jgi:hypothetical protein
VLDVVAPAVRPVGAVGGASTGTPPVVAVALADDADTLPAASRARTVYAYAVPGVRPVSVNVVPVARPARVVPR